MHSESLRQVGDQSIGTIELTGRGRRQQSVGARIHVDVNGKTIAANDATWRMHDVAMANICFGIKRPLNPQRTEMLALA
jgi:hypothetical protein